MQGIIETQTINTIENGKHDHNESHNNGECEEEKEKDIIISCDELSQDSDVVLMETENGEDSILSINSESDKNSDIMIVENQNDLKGLNPKSPVVLDIISDSEDCILFDQDSNNKNNKQGQSKITEKSNKENGDDKLNIEADDVNNSNQETKEVNEQLLTDESQKSVTHINETENNPTVQPDSKHLNKVKEVNVSSGKEVTLPTGQFNQNIDDVGVNVKVVANNAVTSAISDIFTSSNSDTVTSETSSWDNVGIEDPAITESKTKTNHKSNGTQTSKPSLPALSNLTDDMHVLETPSFIVPMLYEKPSITPFREFVDILGKQLDDDEKAKKKKELQKSSEKEIPDNNDSENSCNSDSIILSCEQINKSLNEALLLNSTRMLQADDYFSFGVGKLCMSIGENLVQEHVQKDLVKQQKNILSLQKKSGFCTKDTESTIISLTKNLNDSIANNRPFSFAQLKCKFCSFKTESRLALAYHLETPHMKNNLYRCNLCSFEIKNSDKILSHMKSMHNVQGHLERAPASAQCHYCPYEDNSKVRMGRHAVSCLKRFNSNFNLIPPLDWEPPAKVARASYQYSSYNFPNSLTAPVRRGNNGGRGGNNKNGQKRRGRQQNAHVVWPILTPSGPVDASNTDLPRNKPTQVIAKSKPATVVPPSVSVTALPRNPPTSCLPSSSTVVICEMCDGCIKDFNELRIHFRNKHQVNIHPKVIMNRPPLSCQKCQSRFFTDKGLERHVLGAHGLVPSSMQEDARLGKDSGCCPACRRVFRVKLLEHYATVHNRFLKPAQLSYKCMVCAETFIYYKRFEKHVYSAHPRPPKAPVATETVTSVTAPPAIVTYANRKSAIVTSVTVKSATVTSATVKSATVTSATVTSATVTNATVTCASVTDLAGKLNSTQDPELATITPLPNATPKKD